jgi:hypothetical protein
VSHMRCRFCMAIGRCNLDKISFCGEKKNWSRI